MIAFLRSTDGNPDSRLQKYIDSVNERKIDFLAFVGIGILNLQTTKITPIIIRKPFMVQE